MPQISVIMPLYNAQKYLVESLDSVLMQTFRDFELICINDGSDDDTLNILKRYQQADARVFVLENEQRSGAAYSRNRGMQQARGKYLMFLDGDDLFEEEMLAVTYEAAEKNHTDVLLFAYKHVPSDRIREKRCVNHGGSYAQKYYDNVFSVKECMPYEFLLWATSPWNKLFKKSFIINNQISFQNLASSNDVYFVNMALMLSERTMLLADNRVMIYARDHMEPSRISTRRNPMCCFDAYEHLMEELIKRGKMEELYLHFFYKAFFSFKYALKGIKNPEEAGQFYKFLRAEGIARLQELSKEYSQNGNAYLESVFAGFECHSVNWEWLEDESILKASLQAEREKLCELFKENSVKRKMVLWGVGRNGQAVLGTCKKYNLKFDYVVDGSREKQGKYIGEQLIMRPEDVLQETSFVIVSPLGVSDQVQKTVKEYNKDSVVIDISDYMAIV